MTLLGHGLGARSFSIVGLGLSEPYCMSMRVLAQETVRILYLRYNPPARPSMHVTASACTLQACTKRRIETKPPASTSDVRRMLSSLAQMQNPSIDTDKVVNTTSFAKSFRFAAVLSGKKHRSSVINGGHLSASAKCELVPLGVKICVLPGIGLRYHNFCSLVLSRTPRRKSESHNVAFG